MDQKGKKFLQVPLQICGFPTGPQINLIEPKSATLANDKQPILGSQGSHQAQDDLTPTSPQFGQINMLVDSADGFIYFDTDLVNSRYIKTLRKYLLQNTYIDAKKQFKRKEAFIYHVCPPDSKIQSNNNQTDHFQRQWDRFYNNYEDNFSGEGGIIQIYQPKQQKYRTSTYHGLNHELFLEKDVNKHFLKTFLKIIRKQKIQYYSQNYLQLNSLRRTSNISSPRRRKLFRRNTMFLDTNIRSPWTPQVKNLSNSFLTANLNIKNKLTNQSNFKWGNEQSIQSSRNSNSESDNSPIPGTRGGFGTFPQATAQFSFADRENSSGYERENYMSSSNLKQKLGKNIFRMSQHKLQAKQNEKRRQQSCLSLRIFHCFEKQRSKFTSGNQSSTSKNLSDYGHKPLSLIPQNTSIKLQKVLSKQPEDVGQLQLMQNKSLLKKKLVSFRKLPDISGIRLVSKNLRSNKTYNEIKTAVENVKKGKELSKQIGDAILPLQYKKSVDDVTQFASERSSKQVQIDTEQTEYNQSTNKKKQIRAIIKGFSNQDCNREGRESIQSFDGKKKKTSLDSWYQSEHYKIDEEVDDLYSNEDKDAVQTKPKLGVKIPPMKLENLIKEDIEDLNRFEEELLVPLFSIQEQDGDSKAKMLQTEKSSQSISSHLSQYSDKNEWFKNHGTEFQKHHFNTTKDKNDQIYPGREVSRFSEISQNYQNYKLQKHLTIRRNQIQQIKFLNKEEEQMASFKYLRTLGSHLKSVVKSPGLFQKFDKIKKVTQDIVLTNYAGQNMSQLKLMPYESDYLKMLDGYKNDQNQEQSDKNSEEEDFQINDYQKQMKMNSMNDLDNKYSQVDESDNVHRIQYNGNNVNHRTLNYKNDEYLIPQYNSKSDNIHRIQYKLKGPQKSYDFNGNTYNQQQMKGPVRQIGSQKLLINEKLNLTDDLGQLTECLEESQSVSQTGSKFVVSTKPNSFIGSNKNLIRNIEEIYQNEYIDEDNQNSTDSIQSRSMSIQSQSYCNEQNQIPSESDNSHKLYQNSADTKIIQGYKSRINLIRHSSIIPYKISEISERQQEESQQSSSIRNPQSSQNSLSQQISKTNLSQTNRNDLCVSEDSDSVQRESNRSIGTDSISITKTESLTKKYSTQKQNLERWIVINNSENSIEDRSIVSSSSPSPLLNSNQILKSEVKSSTFKNKNPLKKNFIINCDQGTSPLTQLTSQSAEEISHSSSIASLESEKESQISEYKKEYFSQMHDKLSQQFQAQQNIDAEQIKVQVVEKVNIDRMDRFKTKTELQINTDQKNSRMKLNNKLSSTRNVNMTGSFSRDSQTNMQLSLTQKMNQIIQKSPSIYGSSQDKYTIISNGQHEQQLLVNDNSTYHIGNKNVYEEEKIPSVEYKVEDVSPQYYDPNQNLAKYNMQQNIEKFDAMIMQDNNLKKNKQQMDPKRKENSSKTIIDSQNNQQQYLKQFKNNNDSFRVSNDNATFTPKSGTLEDTRSPENRVYSQRDKIKPVLWKLFSTQQEIDTKIRNQNMPNIQNQANQNEQSSLVQPPQIIRESSNKIPNFNNLVQLSSSQVSEHASTASLYTKSPLNKDHLFTENDHSVNNITSHIQQMRRQEEQQQQEQNELIDERIIAEQENQFINNIMYKTASVFPSSNNQNTQGTNESFNQQIQIDNLNHLQTYQTHHSVGNANRMEFQYEEEKYSNQQIQARFFPIPTNSVYDNVGSSPSWSKNPNSVVAQQNESQVQDQKNNEYSPQSKLLSSFNSIKMLHKTNDSKISQSRQRSKAKYQNEQIQQNTQNIVIFDKDKFSSHLQDEMQSRNIQSFTTQQKSYPINKKQSTEPLDQINQYSSMNSQQYPQLINITSLKFRTEQNTQQNSPRMVPKSSYSQKRINKGQHLKQNFLNDLRKNLEKLDVHIDNDANSTYEKYLQYGQINNSQAHYMQQQLTVPHTPLSPLNPLSEMSQPFTRLQHLRNVISSRGSSLSPVSNSNQNFNSFQNTNQFVTRQNSVQEEHHEEIKELISNNNKINYNPLLKKSKNLLRGKSQAMKRGITKYEQEFNKQITLQDNKSRSKSNKRNKSQDQQNSSHRKLSFPFSPTVSQERDESVIRVGQMNLTPNRQTENENQQIELTNMNKYSQNNTNMNIRSQINNYQNIDKKVDPQNPNMKTEPQLDERQQPYQQFNIYPDFQREYNNEEQLQETFAQSQYHYENENQQQQQKQYNEQYVQSVNQDIFNIESQEQRQQKALNVRAQLQNGSQQINFNMSQQLSQQSRNESQGKKFRTQIQTPNSEFDYQVLHQPIQTTKNQDLKHKQLIYPTHQSHQWNDQQIYNRTHEVNQRPSLTSHDQLYHQNQQPYPLIRQINSSSTPQNSYNSINVNKMALTPPNNLSAPMSKTMKFQRPQRMQPDIINTTQQLQPSISTEFYRDMQSNNLNFGPQFQTYHVKPKNEQQFIQRDFNNNVQSQDQQYMRMMQNQPDNSHLRSYPSSNNYRYMNQPPVQQALSPKVYHDPGMISPQYMMINLNYIGVPERNSPKIILNANPNGGNSWNQNMQNNNSRNMGYFNSQIQPYNSYNQPPNNQSQN